MIESIAHYQKLWVDACDACDAWEYFGSICYDWKSLAWSNDVSESNASQQEVRPPSWWTWTDRRELELMLGIIWGVLVMHSWTTWCLVGSIWRKQAGGRLNTTHGSLWEQIPSSVKETIYKRHQISINLKGNEKWIIHSQGYCLTLLICPVFTIL